MQCAAKERCQPKTMKHFCALCEKELHGCCGVFNDDDAAVTYHNRCYDCSEKSFCGNKDPLMQHGISSSIESPAPSTREHIGSPTTRAMARIAEEAVSSVVVPAPTKKSTAYVKCSFKSCKNVDE